MLYKLVRILLGAGIITALLLFLKKRRKWQIRTLAIFSAMILFGVLCACPFENLIFSFPTPEKAHAYRYEDTIQLVLPGEESCFILSETAKKETSHSLLIRAKDGWKLDDSLPLTDYSFSLFTPEISLTVYRCKNTGDYYLTIFHIEEGPLDIQDNRGSSFLFRSKEIPSLQKTYYTYCAAVRDIDSSYTLTINGEVWPIGEKIASAS